jgi:hypothetical protein
MAVQTHQVAPTSTAASAAGVRDAVARWLQDAVEAGGPCSVVESVQAYAPVQAARPGTPDETIREALQALSAGSSRVGARVAKTVYAVYVKDPAEAVAKTRYLAIPAIPRDRIGHGASIATRAIQQEFQVALGSEVVSFWLNQVQLQSISLVRNGAAKVRSRDGNRCKICGGSETTVCHLVKRRDAFWRVLGQVVTANRGNHAVIFTPVGVAAVKKALKAELYHTSPAYMVCLCTRHDALIQRTSFFSDARRRFAAASRGR